MRSRCAAVLVVLAIGMLASTSLPDPLDAQGVVERVRGSDPTYRSSAADEPIVTLESVTIAHEFAARLAAAPNPTCVDIDGKFHVTITGEADCESARAAVVPLCPRDDAESSQRAAQAFIESGHRFWVFICRDEYAGIMYQQPRPQLVILPPAIGRGT